VEAVLSVIFVYPYNAAFTADAVDYADADCFVCTDADINAAVASIWPFLSAFYMFASTAPLQASAAQPPLTTVFHAQHQPQHKPESCENIPSSEILEYKQIQPKGPQFRYFRGHFV
jgi:hypothetical protein